MSVLTVLQWPDPRLSEVCDPVGNRDISTLISDMLETMYASDGRGLAAPQVGVMLRVFVMDVEWKDDDKSPIVCIDPELISASEDVTSMTEGCLSIPDAPVEVIRPEAVAMRWTDAHGHRKIYALEDISARCAQHELDHLNGRVIFDHLSVETRAELEGAYLEGAQ